MFCYAHACSTVVTHSYVGIQVSVACACRLALFWRAHVCVDSLSAVDGAKVCHHPVTKELGTPHFKFAGPIPANQEPFRADCNKHGPEKENPLEHIEGYTNNTQEQGNLHVVKVEHGKNGQSIGNNNESNIREQGVISN